MTSLTPSDRAAMRAKIVDRSKGFEGICGVCKQRLTEEDVKKVKHIAAVLKTLSGAAFGAKRHCAGYQLKDLAKMLDSILFGRE